MSIWSMHGILKRDRDKLGCLENKTTTGFYYFVHFGFGTTTGCAPGSVPRGSLLIVLREPYAVLGIEPQLVVYKGLYYPLALDSF